MIRDEPAGGETAVAHSLDPATRKLVSVLGQARADVLRADVLQRIGSDDLRDPDVLLLFGQELMKRGGILAAIGRSIKIQAILLGAR